MNYRFQKISVLSGLVITTLVTVALVVTYFANRYNIRGLDRVVIGAWLVIVAVAVSLNRAHFSRREVAIVVPCWVCLGLVTYVVVYHYVFGWIGFSK